MAGADDVVIRQMRVSDIPAGLSLCRAARWNQTERDWQHFLTTAPSGALVAEAGRNVIGTVATLPYGPFAWISMVLVDPAARGKGVGTLLLERGLELIPGDVTARLDATPAGEVLYRKLGFAGEYGISRWFTDRTRPAAALERGVRRLQPTDWDAVLEMDAAAFGASRADLLRRLASDAAEYAWVLESGGELRGFIFGRHGHVRELLGPLVARDDHSAWALVDACFGVLAGRAMFIDVPDDQKAFRDRLAGAGFAIERPFLRMYRGVRTAPGQPSLVYAIAGPELG